MLLGSDGHWQDVRAVPLDHLRSRVGLVTQEVQLFSASVRDNLTLFGALDAASDDRLAWALDEVGLGDWLRSLPRGLDTPLLTGEGGLSAGQAQLLALARVFLRDPGLVLLDEASSRLDPAGQARARISRGAAATRANRHHHRSPPEHAAARGRGARARIGRGSGAR